MILHGNSKRRELETAEAGQKKTRHREGHSKKKRKKKKTLWMRHSSGQKRKRYGVERDAKHKMPRKKAKKGKGDEVRRQEGKVGGFFRSRWGAYTLALWETNIFQQGKKRIIFRWKKKGEVWDRKKPANLHYRPG